MIELDQDIEIDASPEEVFDFLADPHNHQKITPSITAVADVEDTEIGKRGSFVFQVMGTSLEGFFEDVAFDRPNRRAYDIEGEMSGSVTWTVEEIDGRSRVRYQSELDLPGPDMLDTITDPIAQRFLRRETGSTLENLQTLVERAETEA